MSARHTSGPWKARFEKVRYVIFVDGEIGEKALATTGGAYPDSQANARLIAAAPELLEALQGLANALEATPGPRGVMELVPSQLENARAVIRKANGAAS